LRRVLILISIFLSCVSFAETQGELKTSARDIKAGDVVNVQLEVWPASVESVERIREYSGNRFLDHFYLSKILKISPSENNTEYIIADLVLVPLSKPEAFSILRLGDENVNVKINFSLEEIVVPKDKPLNVWEARITPNYFLYGVGFFSFLLILAGLYLKFKPKQKVIMQREIIDWKDLKSRTDFERKFFELKEVTDQLDNQDVKLFKNIVEQRLYIRDWDENVIEDLKKISERMANGIH